MKILFDCTELSYYLSNSGHRAGIFNVALNLFREFKKRNVEMTLFCDFKRYYFMKEVLNTVPEFSGIKMLEENSFINRTFAFLNYIARKAPLKIQYIFSRLSRYYDNLFYIRNKQNSEQLKNFDVYFSPFTPPSKEIEKSDLKKFRMIHDVIPIIENGMTKNPRHWYYKVYNTINENEFYFSNSENTKKDILKYFPQVSPSNVKTAYLGANQNFRQEKDDKVEKYIFSLCTLGKRKNLAFAIKNFDAFIKRYNIKDLKLVLAGDMWNSFKKELENALHDADISKIVIKGYVKDEELPKLYSNALCFIYPSLYEGFGLPVLEAMQCGCPVITSNTSSIPEVIGDAGIKINPENNEELIEAYRKMYYDNFYRELASERGLIRAKKFSWKKCADDILSFINEKC